MGNNCKSRAGGADKVSEGRHAHTREQALPHPRSVLERCMGAQRVPFHRFRVHVGQLFAQNRLATVGFLNPHFTVYHSPPYLR